LPLLQLFVSLTIFVVLYDCASAKPYVAANSPIAIMTFSMSLTNVHHSDDSSRFDCMLNRIRKTPDNYTANTFHTWPF